MSFGYGVGDFLAILDLANTIRKRFVNAPSQFKSIADVSKTLSNVLRDIEDIYLEVGLSIQQQNHLNDASRACHDVLDDLQCKLNIYQELDPGNKRLGGTCRRVWKRLKWDQAEMGEFQQRIHAHIEVFSLFINSLNSHVAFATKEVVDRINHTIDDHIEQKIADWLTPVNYATQQSDFLSRRQDGTGRWLLGAKNFQKWIDNDKQRLLCTGIPGAGKTILTSIVIDYLEEKFRHDRTVGIAYIYCSFRRRHEQRVEDVLASLMKQLLQRMPLLPDNIRALYTDHKKRQTRPRLDDLSQHLNVIVACFSRVFILVDALDEFTVSDGSISKLLSELFRLQNNHVTNLFATTRHNPGIRSAFGACLQQEISAVAEDVQAYLQGHLSQLPGFVLRNSVLQAEIIGTITKTVDGMFLLAHLHLGSLIGKRSPKAVRDALRKLPSGTDAYDIAYQDAMDRINGQVVGEREMANQIIAWITCAQKPLTILELQHALAVEIEETEFDQENLPDTQDMVSVCAGLVTVDEQSHIIRLVHHTTQEYFERTQIKWFPQAHYDIARTCITYLSYDVFQSGPCSTDHEFIDRLHDYPLYGYCSYQWGHHVRMGRVDSELVDTFLQDEGKVSACSQGLIAVQTFTQVAGWSEQLPTWVTGAHLAAYFGLEDTLRKLIETGCPYNTLDVTDRSPLSWAAENGHQGATSLLIVKGLNPNHEDKWGLTPLALAAANGHDQVVSLLLDIGADPDLKSNNGRTSLSRAAENGHDLVVHHLLLYTMDKNSLDDDGQTPLLWAARYGQVKIVKLLLEANCDPDIKDTEYGWTALSWAAGHGHEDVVRLLLTKGVDLVGSDYKGRTPLSWAVDNGHVSVTRLLLGQGIDPDHKDGAGKTALLRSSCQGYIEVVRVLLENGADPNLEDAQQGLTPLIWAVRNGHANVVECLLDNGADLNLTDPMLNRHPLIWAIMEGNADMVKVLLSQDVNLDLQDPMTGETPLIWAAGSDHESMIRLLLERGANPNYKSRDGLTPLLAASLLGGSRTVALLLEHGAEQQHGDPTYGRTPLSWAAEMGHESICKRLLEAGGDPEAGDNDGRTSLAWAAVKGHEHIAKLLLQFSATPDSTDKFGRTPLLGAAAAGHANLVRLLLDIPSIYPSSRDIYSREAAVEARKRGHDEVVRLLSGPGEATACDGVLQVGRVTETQGKTACDVCLVSIPDIEYHFHCNECDGGDFDLCRYCQESGASCLDSTHELAIRRRVRS